MCSVRRTADRDRTFTEDARRAQLIACAIEVLAESGYAQASFARIAERAGISRSVISYHFAGKRELLQEVVRTVYEAGAQYVTPRIQEQRSAPEMLVACLRANIEFICGHGSGIAAVAEIVRNLRASEPAPARPVGGQRDELILRGIQAILDKGQADGDFRDFDTRTVAWVIRGALDGVHQRATSEPAFDVEACIRELTSLFERATSVRTL